MRTLDDGKVGVIVLTALLFAAAAAVPILSINAAEKCSNATLYSLTFHPQKEHVVLCHPTGKDLIKANNANILFNKGIVAKQYSTLTKCPSSNRIFCSGWDWGKRYG